MVEHLSQWWTRRQSSPVGCWYLQVKHSGVCESDAGAVVSEMWVSVIRRRQQMNSCTQLRITQHSTADCDSLAGGKEMNEWGSRRKGVSSGFVTHQPLPPALATQCWPTFPVSLKKVSVHCSRWGQVNTQYLVTSRTNTRASPAPAKNRSLINFSRSLFGLLHETSYIAEDWIERPHSRRYRW